MGSCCGCCCRSRNSKKKQTNYLDQRALLQKQTKKIDKPAAKNTYEQQKLVREKEKLKKVFRERCKEKEVFTNRLIEIRLKDKIGDISIFCFEESQKNQADLASRAQLIEKLKQKFIDVKSFPNIDDCHQELLKLSSSNVSSKDNALTKSVYLVVSSRQLQKVIDCKAEQLPCLTKVLVLEQIREEEHSDNEKIKVVPGDFDLIVKFLLQECKKLQLKNLKFSNDPKKFTTLSYLELIAKLVMDEKLPYKTESKQQAFEDLKVFAQSYIIENYKDQHSQDEQQNLKSKFLNDMSEVKKEEGREEQDIKEQEIKEQEKREEARIQEAKIQEAKRSELKKKEVNKEEALKEEAIKEEAKKEQAQKELAMKEQAKKQEAKKYKAIFWYAKQCFVSPMLNAVIRSGNLLQLFYIRLYIKRLLEEFIKLQQQQEQEKDEFSEELLLYRLIKIQQAEFEMWRKQKVVLMMQGFTNTASDLKLFDQVVGESGSQTVLLEIKVPKKAVNKPIKNPDQNDNEGTEYFLQMNSILELNSNSFKEVKERSLSIVECELQDFKSDFMPKVKLSDPDNPNSDLVVGFCENEQVHLQNRVLDYPRDKSEEIAYVDKLILGGYYEQTIDMLKGRVNDTTNVINAQRIFYLGMAHYNLNNFAEALENFIKAFNLQINGAGNQDELAVAHQYIALVCEQLGAYSDAQQYYLEALAIRKKVLGEGHPKTAILYNCLGQIYYLREKYPEALSNLARAQKILSKNFLELAVTDYTLGNVYYAKKEFPKALEHHTKALDARKQLLGQEHLETALSYFNTSSVYFAIGDFQKALDNGLKAFTIRKKLLGEDNIKTGCSQYNLGNVYQKLGKYKLAIENYEKAQKIQEKANQNNDLDLDIADTFNNLGTVHFLKREFKQATENYSKALSIRTNYFRNNHPSIADLYHNIGLNCYEMGDSKAALQYHQQALEIRTNSLGQDHIDTADSHHNIAIVYFQTGEYDKALKAFNISLKIKEAFPNSYQRQKGDTYYNLGMTYQKISNFLQAKINYQKARDSYLSLPDKNQDEIEKVDKQIGLINAKIFQAEK